MRVIQTEMYFDPRDIEGLASGSHPDNPGLAFAWFGSDAHGVANPRELPGFIPVVDDHNDIDSFLSLSAQGAVGRQALGQLDATTVLNRRIVDFVLIQPVVIERSPPLAVPFKELVGKNAHVVIGTYMGVSIAGDDPLLMLISVSGGIIVIGSAIAVSTALAKGINKAIEKLFKRLLR
jgi:hypothetical protein